MTESREPDGALNPERLRRMKLLIIAEERRNLQTRAYSAEQMLERIRKIIEQEAD